MVHFIPRKFTVFLGVVAWAGLLEGVSLSHLEKRGDTNQKDGFESLAHRERRIGGLSNELVSISIPTSNRVEIPNKNRYDMSNPTNYKGNSISKAVDFKIEIGSAIQQLQSKFPPVQPRISSNSIKQETLRSKHAVNSLSPGTRPSIASSKNLPSGDTFKRFEYDLRAKYPTVQFRSKPGLVKSQHRPLDSTTFSPSPNQERRLSISSTSESVSGHRGRTLNSTATVSSLQSKYPTVTFRSKQEPSLPSRSRHSSLMPTVEQLASIYHDARSSYSSSSSSSSNSVVDPRVQAVQSKYPTVVFRKKTE
jgi:hypothetical protein